MGWTGEYIYGKLTYAEEKRRVEKKYTATLASGCTMRPIQVSNARPNWFIAIEVTIPAGVTHDPSPYIAETLADGSRRYVFAEVLLCNMSKNEWMYKEISETSGPYVCNAPVGLLAKLSPLEDGPSTYDTVLGDGKIYTYSTQRGSALEWRASVEKAAAAKRKMRALKEGQTIRLNNALLLTAYHGQPHDLGTYARDFEKVDSTKYGYAACPTAFRRVDNGAILKISPMTLASGFEIIE